MAGPKNRLWTAAVAIATMTLAAPFPATDGQASARPSPARAPVVGRVTVGRLSPVTSGATRIGTTPGATALSFDLVLKPRDPGALARFATAVSTPGNPQYRHFLPKGRLARTFGPTPATIASVRAALRQAGLSPGPVSANGLIIPVAATVGRAEAAFHTAIDSYRLSSGRTAVADTKTPSLPTSVASSVEAVVGLNTTVAAQSQAIQSPATQSPAPVSRSSAGPDTTVPADDPSAPVTPCPAALEARGGGYTSQQLTSAYGFDSLYADGDFGAGAAVALVELEPYDSTDIATFQSCYGTSVAVNPITVDGGAGKGPGSGEAALDIENVIELAPEVAIDVYEAPNTSKGFVDDYARIAADDSAQVVSTSWGLCEAFDQQSMTAETAIFQEMTAQGQTVVADSGDSGSADCIPRDGAITVPTGKDPVAVATDPGTGTVYVADKGSDDVAVESESKLARVHTVTAHGDPDGVAVDPDTHAVYVADGTNPGAVSVISGETCDATDQSRCAMVTIPDVGSTPAGIAVDPADGTVYVADTGSGTVSVISEASDTVVATVALPSGSAPVGIALDTSSHDVYLTDPAADTVSVIDGASCDAAIQTGCASTPAVIDVGSGPQAVVANPVTHVVAVADTKDGDVTLIDGSTGTLMAAGVSQLPGDPEAMALSPDGSELFVTLTNTSCGGFGGGLETRAGRGNRGCPHPLVAVVSTSTWAVTMYLVTAAGPAAVAVDASTGDVVVAAAKARGGGALGVIPLSLAVDDPASQPDVTGVGGTDLTKWWVPTETAWGVPADPEFDEPLGAGGGGISSVFAMPAYQAAVAGPQSSGAPCGAPSGDDCREVPDVSASASFAYGYAIFYDGAWTTFGGTSGATPLWAALTALAVTENGPPQRLGNINPDLYRLAAEGRPDFNDITSGDTDYTTTNDGNYAAGPGYDMATGLGSPKASSLAADLDPFVVTTDPVSQTVVAGQDVSFTVASSGSPAPTVQWEVSTDGGSTYSASAGATSDTDSFDATASENGDDFEAVLTNPAGSFTTAAATLDVFAITTTSLPAATAGRAYRVQLEAAGGSGPYTWSYSGSLPPGLTLTSKGLLAGKPKAPKKNRGAPSTYTVTITATTTASPGHPGLTDDQVLTLLIQAPGAALRGR